jgi:hypothetical protein
MGLGATEEPPDSYHFGWDLIGHIVGTTDRVAKLLECPHRGARFKDNGTITLPFLINIDDVVWEVNRAPKWTKLKYDWTFTFCPGEFDWEGYDNTVPTK